MRESFIADIAVVRFFACMYAHVNPQFGFFGELFLAYGACVWFIACMRELVYVAVIRPCEAFMADITVIRLCARVLRLVIYVATLITKSLKADLAFIGLWDGV